MQAPFQLTKSRKLYNDSMWKKKVEVIPPYKIVVVRTCILKFLHSDPPRACEATVMNERLEWLFGEGNTKDVCRLDAY
jgi:hypothetical protein